MHNQNQHETASIFNDTGNIRSSEFCLTSKLVSLVFNISASEIHIYCSNILSSNFPVKAYIRISQLL